MKDPLSLSGKIIQTRKGYKAFIPNSLPPKIVWTDPLVHDLSRADFLLGKLAREGNKLPNPHIFIRPFITREAVLSSKIEGTQATIGEMLAHNAGIKVQHNPDDLQEVQNYIKALDFAVKRLQTLPLSQRLIKEIHAHLMEGARGAHATPGDFRKSQNWIGPPGCTINTAKFIPPPPEYLMDCLGELEKFLHVRKLPPLIHAALCHYQFEAIHPFLDGNGRVGRLLIILLLIEQNILPSPLLYLSAFFEATREEYYKQLTQISTHNTWNEWLAYFLNGVALQSEDALSRAERINELLNRWRLRVASTKTHMDIKIVEHFAINPFLTTKNIASELNIAYSTAQRSLQRLLAHEIIQPINDAKRGKVYCASQILAILEEPAKINADL